MTAEPVTVDVLGPLRATVGGAPADLGGPRQRAVLARLVAGGGHVVSTDRFVDDMWDGEPPPKALAALQVHVSNLRRALEPGRARRAPAEVLTSVPPGYALHLPADAVDAWRFEGLLRRAADVPDVAGRRDLLRAALDCWAGDAYSEFADAAWAGPEVARLSELRLVAFELHAAAELDLGQAARLVPDLERHLTGHPLREEAVRLLALALYRAGRQGDSLAALRAARDRLSDGLGIDPGPALQKLEADVLAQADSLMAPAPTASPVIMETSGVLHDQPNPAQLSPDTRSFHDHGKPGGRRATSIGRADQVLKLNQAADEAKSHGLRLVWIGGEAGAGKTTLCEVVTDQLAASGWTTAWGRCPEVDGAPPAWAWTEVVAGLHGVRPEAEVVEESAFRLARSVAGQLRARVAGGPLLVVLDDVHRADSATLQLLRQLSLELADAPVLVIAGYRPSEADEELGATWAVLAAATADRLELTGLTRDGVRELAHESGLDPDGAVVDVLLERTGGNPLFVRELARLLASEGRDAARQAVPAGVRDVLRRRVARLPGPAQTVLRQAAVLGRDVDVDLLVEVGGRDEDELLDGLESAVLAGILSEPSPGRVRFTHALIRDCVYEETPMLRRVRWHSAALDVLRAGGRADPAALAHHALAAATPQTAAEASRYAEAAARQALSLGAQGEAKRLLEAALAMLDLAGDTDAERRIELLVELVPAAARSADAVRARSARAEAVALAQRLGRDDLLVQALSSYRAPVAWAIRAWNDGGSPAAIMREVLEAPPDRYALDDVTRVWLLFGLIFEQEDQAARYGMDDVLRWSTEALELARATGDPLALCAALNARSYLALGPDLVEERERDARELTDLATAHGLQDYQALGHWFLFMYHGSVTDLVGARREAALALEQSTSGQLGFLLGALGYFEAELAVLDGRLDEAAARYRTLARQMVDNGAPNGTELAVLGDVVVGFARGDLAGAVAGLREVHAMSDEAFPQALVLALLDAGLEEEARAVWDPAVPVPRGYYWLAMMTVKAYAAARVGDGETSATIYAQLLPWAGRVAGIDAGSVSFGPVDAALAELADRLGRPLDADRHRADAERVRQVVADQLG
ncbi:BTAD domain-containing putative transcriptional regulator [Spongisporangium articulatum]|uniref:BTAD domain-containing putative transcriptional regulator n=1 Tax=Spongisporangium articulatum TaxID=3362603 RepID=A0ABW8AJ33_9ACTN